MGRPRKEPGTAVANIDEQLAKEAAELSQRIQQTEALAIKLRKDKTFEMPNGGIITEPLKLIVVDFRARNSYFDRPYKEGDPTPPGCLAIGTVIDTMAPFPDSPNKQNETCKGCGMNEFGTSATGDGKACRNQRVLAVLGFNGGKITEDAPLLMLTVSPSGLKGFDGYVEGIVRTMGQPPIAVVTEVSFDPTTEYQKLMFKVLGPNPAKAVCFSRREDAKTLLDRKPDFSSYVPLTQAKGRGRRV